MQKQLKLKLALAFTSFSIFSIILTGCGGSNSGANTSTVNQTELTENTAEAVTATFNTPLDLGDGVSITFSENVAFSPTVFASNFEKGQIANKIGISLTNGTSAPLDVSSIAIAINSAGNSCTDILDGDNGVAGAPTEPVAAGKSVELTYGIGCKEEKGTPLTFSATYAGKVVSIEGTLK
jgi:hypothetical protein